MALARILVTGNSRITISRVRHDDVTGWDEKTPERLVATEKSRNHRRDFPGPAHSHPMRDEHGLAQDGSTNVAEDGRMKSTDPPRPRFIPAPPA